tara:strand:+ start:865 stop:984 length:120 start_codon:yes stop_codon:yes gene_type:complete
MLVVVTTIAPIFLIIVTGFCLRQTSSKGFRRRDGGVLDL